MRPSLVQTNRNLTGAFYDLLNKSLHLKYKNDALGVVALWSGEVSMHILTRILEHLTFPLSQQFKMCSYFQRNTDTHEQEFI